jgi:hippurate hydrolase
VNAALRAVLDPAGIKTDLPSSMGSEDCQHLIRPGQKTTYDYIRVGTAHPDLYAKAIAEGKQAPYFNHNGNYQVDLAAIPLGTVIGATGLMAMFRQ